MKKRLGTKHEVETNVQHELIVHKQILEVITYKMSTNSTRIIEENGIPSKKITQALNLN